MKKSLFTVSLLMIACIVTAGSYEYLRIPTTGATTIKTAGAAKVMMIEVAGSAVANGTVVLHRQVFGTTVSNEQYTVTCVNGNAVVGLTSTNTFYVASGDTLYRTGTATNGMVRLVLQ